MRVAVVILNWNGKNFLQKFLPALIQHIEPDTGVIVADNASTDNSLDFLKNHFPQIHIISNPDNGGFARGYNLALKQVEAEYYVLLNSDIEVTENWIKPVIEIMDRDASIGACQPKIRSYLEPKKFEYAGAAGGFIDKYGYPFCRGRMFTQIEEDHGQYDNVHEIFWASGACLFVKSKLYHELGGFDEDFFAHMEEIDFCWRMNNAGYRIMYCPDSTVFHIGGGTLPKISWRKTYLNFRNNFILLYKNLPESWLVRVFTVRLLLDGVAAMKFLIQAGFKDFWAVARAHFSFYRSLSKTRQKRKSIKQGSVRNIYRGSLVFDYFILRKRKFSQLKPSKFKS